MRKKVLIVGGVAGGASAATRLRRMDEHAEIILFERGEYISFANCGLPYYIGGAIKKRAALMVMTPQAMQGRFNIDVRVQQEVVHIDKEQKSVSVKNLVTGDTYQESYDYLILSPGAIPIKPPIPGIDAANLFTVRNIPDIDRIKAHVSNSKLETAVVIGGGFVGLEMAENLHELGLKVTIVEKGSQVMGPVDYEMAAIVHEHILSKGVKLYLEDGVTEFKQEGQKTQVVLESGKRLEADIIIFAIGVKPDIGFVKEAGLKIGERGGVEVNEYLATSDPNIYAIGDAIEVKDFVIGNQVLIPLAGPANKQGRIVANNIVGKKETYKGTQGTAVAKVFDLTVAATGSNERNLKANGIECLATITHSKSHAGYYPGSTPMFIKLIYSPKGELLGSQIVGYHGVDKRIDIIATALRFKGTVFDLQELELAYAPPYGSAKDPVNMAGYVATNLLEGNLEVINWDEIEKLDPEKSLIIDVATPEERKLGQIKGSINIPIGEFRCRISEIPKDKEIVLYCQIGLRSYIAYRMLKQHGYTNVKVLTGGIKHYDAVKKSEEYLKNQDQPGISAQDLAKQDIYNTETK